MVPREWAVGIFSVTAAPALQDFRARSRNYTFSVVPARLPSPNSRLPQPLDQDSRLVAEEASDSA
jgi:hypothetical protein